MAKPVLTPEMKRDLIEDARDIFQNGFENGFAVSLEVIRGIANDGPAELRPLAAQIHTLLQNEMAGFTEKARSMFQPQMDNMRITFKQ